MAEHRIITRTAERKGQKVRLGISMTIHWLEPNSVELNDWYEQTFGRTQLTFARMDDPGMMTAYEILAAGRAQDKERIVELVPKMESHLLPNYEDLPALERWKRAALAMPGDIAGANKAEETRILTERAHGRVLETMCGFNSYFAPADHIDEVVVLDFCEEMLQRYEHPQRTRILYDLENVVAGERMDFFPDESFQSVGCWGTNYLSDPSQLFAEFARILSPQGRLLILENTSEGYPDLVRRYFNPRECAAWMKEAGLETSIERLQIGSKEWRVGKYYLVTGTKH